MEWGCGVRERLQGMEEVSTRVSCTSHHVVLKAVWGQGKHSEGDSPRPLQYATIWAHPPRPSFAEQVLCFLSKVPALTLISSEVPRVLFIQDCSLILLAALPRPLPNGEPGVRAPLERDFKVLI